MRTDKRWKIITNFHPKTKWFRLKYRKVNLKNTYQTQKAIYESRTKSFYKALWNRYLLELERKG